MVELKQITHSVLRSEDQREETVLGCGAQQKRGDWMSSVLLFYTGDKDCWNGNGEFLSCGTGCISAITKPQNVARYDVIKYIVFRNETGQKPPVILYVPFLRSVLKASFGSLIFIPTQFIILRSIWNAIQISSLLCASCLWGITAEPRKRCLAERRHGEHTTFSRAYTWTSASCHGSQGVIGTPAHLHSHHLGSN